MTIYFDKIPNDLKSYPQWVCWRYEVRDGKHTKLPYDPKNGHLADVSNPGTWSSYEQAVASLTSGFHRYNGIGFVLTRRDPFTFIDLDETNDPAQIDIQMKIFNGLPSYAERSPSGKGLHIIVRAELLNGRRRDKVEIYSSERYMTVTGDVFRDLPIAPLQNAATTLWEQLTPVSKSYLVKHQSQPQKYTDEEIIQRALAADNGEKFRILHEGDWQTLYPSQSEADLAYVSIIAFYTECHEQLVRLFHASPLGQREKAQRTDYLSNLVNKAYDQTLPVQQLPEYIEAVNRRLAEIAHEKETKQLQQHSRAVAAIKDDQAVISAEDSITFPPGLIGEIAQYIYDSSPRPVKLISLVAAIGLMAGICGRAYNVSNTGLNLYIMLLAGTGVGKEAISSGIERLMKEVIKQVPAAEKFLGPADIASGQALIKYLGRSLPSFVSVIGEFGIKLQQITSPRAGNHDKQLERVLLDLFTKSGPKNQVRATIHADKANDAPSVPSPAVTIIGETTPEKFYAMLDDECIASGLIPRFLTLHYNGKRNYMNKNHDKVPIPDGLVAKLVTLCLFSLQAQSGNPGDPAGNPLSSVPVRYAEGAEEWSDQLDKNVTDAMNDNRNEILAQLWNRAHLKTLRLGALLAISQNHVQPQMTIENLSWAYNLASIDTVNIAEKVAKGQIGQNTHEIDQIERVMATIKDYLSSTYHAVAKDCSSEQMFINRIIPYGYVSRRVSAYAAFRKAKNGAASALRECFRTLCERGDLKQLDPKITEIQYNYKGQTYMLGNFMHLTGDDET